MITLDKISKKMGSRILFEDAFSFSSGHRTVLPDLMAPENRLDEDHDGPEPANLGNIRRPKKLGFLRQNIEDFHDYKLIDTVIMEPTPMVRYGRKIVSMKWR